MPFKIRSICAWRTVCGSSWPLSLPELSLPVAGMVCPHFILIKPRELFSINRMTSGDPEPGNLVSDPAQLLTLALSRPHEAVLAARSVIADRPTAYDASLAHHAIGIVQR